MWSVKALRCVAGSRYLYLSADFCSHNHHLPTTHTRITFIAPEVPARVTGSSEMLSAASCKFSHRFAPVTPCGSPAATLGSSLLTATLLGTTYAAASAAAMEGVEQHPRDGPADKMPCSSGRWAGRTSARSGGAAAAMPKTTQASRLTAQGY